MPFSRQPVDGNPPGDAGQKRAFVPQLFPCGSGVYPQKRLLHHILAIVRIPQDRKRDTKDEPRLTVNQSGKALAARYSFFLSRQHGSRERDLSSTAVIHEARSKAKTGGRAAPFIFISRAEGVYS